jgi:hypothetical protein
VGKPNEREREREIYYSASGKYISTTKQHFQPRKIPHSTKSVPQKSASFSVPKSYRCPASSIPHFSCPQSIVRTVPYGPKTTTENLKIASKTVPKIASISCQIRTTVRNRTDCTDPYSTASHSRKIFRPKIHRKFSRESCPLSSKKCALFAAHFPLSSILRKYL